MKTISSADVVKLPLQDRIQLVEDIWDSIAAMPEALEVPDWHRKELDRRLDAHRASPEAGSSWPEVKRRVLGGQ